jgi:hypothetical protein
LGERGFISLNNKEINLILYLLVIVFCFQMMKRGRPPTKKGKINHDDRLLAKMEVAKQRAEAGEDPVVEKVDDDADEVPFPPLSGEEFAKILDRLESLFATHVFHPVNPTDTISIYDQERLDKHPSFGKLFPPSVCEWFLRMQYECIKGAWLGDTKTSRERFVHKMDTFLQSLVEKWSETHFQTTIALKQGGFILNKV